MLTLYRTNCYTLVNNWDQNFLFKNPVDFLACSVFIFNFDWPGGISLYTYSIIYRSKNHYITLYIKSKLKIRNQPSYFYVNTKSNVNICTLFVNSVSPPTKTQSQISVCRLRPVISLWALMRTHPHRGIIGIWKKEIRGQKFPGWLS